MLEAISKLKLKSSKNDLSNLVLYLPAYSWTGISQIASFAGTVLILHWQPVLFYWWPSVPQPALAWQTRQRQAVSAGPVLATRTDAAQHSYFWMSNGYQLIYTAGLLSTSYCFSFVFWRFVPLYHCILHIGSYTLRCFCKSISSL